MTGIAALTARRCRKPLRRRPRWMSISRMPPRRAENATFSLFQATDEEFDAIFSGEGQDMELIEDFTERVGEGQALRILLPVWERPILKRDAQGIHGTLYYEYADRRRYLPASKREVDWDDSSINIAQRRLFASNAKVRNSPAAMNGPKIPHAEVLGRLVPNISVGPSRTDGRRQRLNTRKPLSRRSPSGGARRRTGPCAGT